MKGYSQHLKDCLIVRAEQVFYLSRGRDCFHVWNWKNLLIWGFVIVVWAVVDLTRNKADI